jgi:hypothetical protein
MAKGLDPMSRREFFARRMGDVGIIALVVAAGPVFGRMLNTLYVQDSGRYHGSRIEPVPRVDQREHAHRDIEPTDTAGL